MIDLSTRIADVSAAMAAWTTARDPLLGAIAAPVADEHTTGELTARSGRATALASATHVEATDPLSLWGPTSADRLQLRLTEHATQEDVAEVLDAWLGTPPAATAPGDDHARVLRLPVVARQAVRPLLERGFAPATTTLVRRVRAADASEAVDGSRDATLEDRAAMVALMRELLETEAEFGAVRSRATGIGDGYVDDALRLESGWARVAEEDAAVVGWASLTPPAESAWAAPSTSAAPSAYLGIATVTAARRSAGIGSRLVRALHARACASDVEATLLDASVLNPWSMPFWHRQGYRPLWITWQRLVPGR